MKKNKDTLHAAFYIFNSWMMILCFVLDSSVTKNNIQVQRVDDYNDWDRALL